MPQWAKTAWVNKRAWTEWLWTTNAPYKPPNWRASGNCKTRHVHHVNLSSFPPPLQGDVLTPNCGIPQRHDKGKIKTATSQAMPCMTKTRWGSRWVKQQHKQKWHNHQNDNCAGNCSSFRCFSASVPTLLAWTRTDRVGRATPDQINQPSDPRPTNGNTWAAAPRMRRQSSRDTKPTSGNFLLLSRS